MMETTDFDKKDNLDPFVKYVFTNKNKDKAFRARLRSALSPNKSYEAWGDISCFVNLNFIHQRQIYILIGSSIALDFSENDGVLSLGVAIAKAWSKDGDITKGPSATRMRRLLACRTVDEVCEILQPLLSLLRNRIPGQLSYSKLINQLKYFDSNPQRIKSEWAQEYFSNMHSK